MIDTVATKRSNMMDKGNRRHNNELYLLKQTGKMHAQLVQSEHVCTQIKHFVGTPFRSQSYSMPKRAINFHAKPGAVYYIP